MPTEYATIVDVVEEIDTKLTAAVREGFVLHSFQALPVNGRLAVVCIMEKTPIAPGTVEPVVAQEAIVKKTLGMRCW